MLEAETRVDRPMRIGLVGYGTGGKHFHAPFMMAAEGVELTGIVARAPATIQSVREDFPDLPVFASLSDMIAAGGIDAVTITTPPQTRRDLVLEAIEADLHVIADKPFAPSAVGARELDAAAKAKGVVLGVFQNRRWDSDIQTLAKVIRDGSLGKIWRIHSRMDFDDPATLEAGPAGDCCATSAATWSTRCCGCWGLRLPSMPSSTLSTCLKAGQTPASRSRSGTRVVRTRISPQASSITSTRANCAPMAMRAATSRKVWTYRPSRSLPASDQSTI